jgi:TolB-like protein/lipopolysaccharide biosynthesis regulator YciM
MKKFFRELQRRNVIKASISYIAISWVLLEASDILFPILGIDPGFVKYFLIALLIGFPFWIAFAYIFEWTPAGYKKTSEVSPEQSEYRSTGKKLNLYIILGLSLAVVLLLSDRIFNVTGGANSTLPEKSIAVLPFINLSNDPDQEYFSDGLTDDILTQLAKIEDFRVISRTSVMQYKDNPPPLSEIGQKLNVGLILEGSVQKSGTQMRITAQLINAKTDKHIWAESYDRPVEDLFSVQRELALAIAEIMKAKLSPEEEKGIQSNPTDNIEAYQLFQRGEYYLNQPHYSEEEWRKAIDYFNEAVSLDPQFAEAYGQLTKCHSRLYYLKSDHTPERKERAEIAAEKALLLDHDNPYILLYVGYYHLWTQEDKNTALRYFERAAKKLNNNVEVLKAKSSIYEVIGEWDKYIDTNEKGIEISPLDLACITNLCYGYFYVQRYAEALELNDRATNLAPDAAWNHLIRGFILISADKANDESRKSLEKVHKDHSWYLWAFYFQNMFEVKYQDLLKLLEHYPEGITHKMMRAPQALLAAHIFSILNQQDKADSAYSVALEILEEEIQTHEDDHRYQSALGLAYAGTGNREAAIRAGKRAIEILPLSKDAFYGVPPQLEMALIYDMLGETDLAMDHLEKVLSIPNYFSINWLLPDARYKNIRSSESYEKLIATYTPVVDFAGIH